MKKRKMILCLILFILILAAVFFFFRQFTNFDAYLADTSLSFDSIKFTDDDGNVTELDQEFLASGAEPRMDGVYTFTTHTDPIQSDDTLSLLAHSSKIRVTVDGEVFFDSSLAFPDGSFPARLFLTLPTSDTGYSISLDYRYEDPTSYIFPPSLSVTSEIKNQAFQASLANYNSVPAGIACLLFLLICGALLLGIATDNPDFSLIFVAAATACYMVTSIFSTNALPQMPFISNYNVNLLLNILVPVTLLIYIFLNRKKRLFRFFLYINLIAAVFLLAATLISVLSGVRIGAASALMYAFSALLSSGSFNAFLSFLTGYLVFSCAGAAILFYASSLSRIFAETRMLREKNRQIASGYDAIVSSYRQTSAIRHEWKNDLLTMHMMYRQNKMQELGEHLEKRNQQIAQTGSVAFTQNFIVDVILQNAARQAAEEDISFRARALLPDQIPMDDGDLCSLLMNMLDNALDACRRIKKKETRRFIDFKAEYKNSFLAISCRNSCEIPEFHADSKKEILSSKEDPVSHGFGLRQMNFIAKKYHSLIDIICEDGIFTVQTALNLKKDETTRRNHTDV